MSLNLVYGVCFFFFMVVGVGWNLPNRARLAATPGENFEHCKFDITFAFEEPLQKFPRMFTNPKEPRFELINYCDFALIQREDVVYPPIKIKTGFEHLDYNFFSEQYFKVKYSFPPFFSVLNSLDDMDSNFF